jgi:hypothetical protein
LLPSIYTSFPLFTFRVPILSVEATAVVDPLPLASTSIEKRSPPDVPKPVVSVLCSSVCSLYAALIFKFPPVVISASPAVMLLPVMFVSPPDFEAYLPLISIAEPWTVLSDTVSVVFLLPYIDPPTPRPLFSVSLLK